MSMTIAPRTAASAAPQVRSRSVSLRLGPFGITYASDQVLWGENAKASVAASAATASAATVSVATVAAASGQKPAPVAPAAAISTPEHTTTQASAQASSQTDTAATQAARRFSSDLEAARTQAMFQRMAENESGSQPGLSATSRVRATASADVGNEDESGADASSQSQPRQSMAGNAAADRPAAVRVRQAIGAYLACAASFGQRACMLKAVA